MQFGSDDNVRVTDVQSGDEMALPGGRGGVYEISMSDDGSRLFAIGDGSAVWDLPQGGPTELGNLATEGTID